MALLILYIGITIFAGFLLKYFVSDKFDIPAVTIYVIMGVFLGVSFFKIYDAKALEHLEFISKIALGIIAFIIGSELKKDVIFSLGKSIVLIAVFEAVAAFLIVMTAVYFLTDLPFYYALILGSVASATAPAATVYVIQQYKSRGPLTSTIMGVVGIDDAIALIIFVFASVIASNIIIGDNLPIYKLMLIPIRSILIAFAIGMTSGFIYSVIMKKIRDNEVILMAIFAFILIQLGLSELFKVSELLSIMIFGAYIVNVNSLLTARAKHNIENLSPIVLPLFFIFAGAHLNVNLIGKIGILGLIYTLARMIGKIGGAFTGAIVGKAKPVVRKWIGFSLIPQVGVAVALALSVSNKFSAPEYGAKGEELASIVINVLLFTTIFTEIVGPLLTKISLKKSGEAMMGKDN